MIKLVFSITCILFAFFSFAQKPTPEAKKYFSLKKDQLTLDIDPFFGVGFSSAWKINNRSAAGIGVLVGLGGRIILNEATFLYCGTGCDTGDCCDEQTSIHPGSFFIEFAQIHSFWRYYLTPRTYFSAGIFTSIGNLRGIELSNKCTLAGIKSGIFTGFDKFKIGINIQAGKSFLTYTNGKKTQFYMIYASPAFQVFF